MHRHMRDPALLGQRASAPMGGSFGLSPERFVDQFGHLLVGNASGSARTQLIVESADAIGGVAAAPFANVNAIHLHPFSNLQIGQPLRGQQNDLCSLH